MLSYIVANIFTIIYALYHICYVKLPDPYVIYLWFKSSCPPMVTECLRIIWTSKHRNQWILSMVVDTCMGVYISGLSADTNAENIRDMIALGSVLMFFQNQITQWHDYVKEELKYEMEENIESSLRERYQRWSFQDRMGEENNTSESKLNNAKQSIWWVYNNLIPNIINSCQSILSFLMICYKLGHTYMFLCVLIFQVGYNVVFQKKKYSVFFEERNKLREKIIKINTEKKIDMMAFQAGEIPASLIMKHSNSVNHMWYQITMGWRDRVTSSNFVMNGCIVMAYLWLSYTTTNDKILYKSFIVLKPAFGMLKSITYTVRNIANCYDKQNTEYNSCMEHWNSKVETPTPEKLPVPANTVITNVDILRKKGKKVTCKLVRKEPFTIHQGDHIYVQGKSGSGKSSLIDAMLGKMQQKDGGVTLNANKPENFYWAVADYYQQSKEKTCFTCTIAKFFRVDTTNEHHMLLLEECFNLCCINDLLERFGVDVEMDGGLSGGQKTRLIIAKHLVDLEIENKKILILDEADGVDEETFELVLVKIRRKMTSRGVTLFVISHFSSVMKGFDWDQVISIKDGQVLVE